MCSSEVVWCLVRPLMFMLWVGLFERFLGRGVAWTDGTAVWVPGYVRMLVFF